MRLFLRMFWFGWLQKRLNRSRCSGADSRAWAKVTNSHRGRECSLAPHGEYDECGGSDAGLHCHHYSKVFAIVDCQWSNEDSQRPAAKKKVRPDTFSGGTRPESRMQCNAE